MSDIEISKRVNIEKSNLSKENDARWSTMLWHVKKKKRSNCELFFIAATGGERMEVSESGVG